MFKSIKIIFFCLLLVFLGSLNVQGEEICTPKKKSITQNFLYFDFLEEFVSNYSIESVVELECSEWNSLQSELWSGIHYTGYCSIKETIKKNQKKYVKESIIFIQRDNTDIEFPEADLFICKDALQNLSNEKVFYILSQFSKFKYCLITNDIDPEMFSANNLFNEKGHRKALDLSKPPFSLDGIKVLTYSTGRSVKQVFLIWNSVN